MRIPIVNITIPLTFGSMAVPAENLNEQRRGHSALFVHVPVLFRLGLLLTLLTLHFLTRQQAASAMPLRDRAFYPFVYRVSLSLLAGRGFETFRLSDAPASRPVSEFFSLQRERLSREECRAFWEGPDGQPIIIPPPEAERHFPNYMGEDEILTSLLHTTRVLDVYMTALLWKVFGVRWSVLATFCAVCSTLTCLLVFLIGRRLGGSFWPGWLGALLYLASPLENDYAIRSLRDISPLWFAALSFFGVCCLVERCRTPARNLLTLGLTGVLAALGCGWRPDALLFCPFLGVTVLLYLRLRGRPWLYVAGGLGLFLFGVVLTHTGIAALCRHPRQSPLVCFHMAYYGEAARCNLLHLEDSFQVSRDDIKTSFDAQHFNALRHIQPGSPDYCSPGYGAVCARLYVATVRDNAFHWVWRFPEFYCRALRACRLQDLPLNGSWQSPTWPRPAWRSALDRWALVPLARWGVVLFFLGVFISLGAGTERLLAGALALFSLYYACALFFVLPEFKHAGPLVLPLAVFGGRGLWALRQLAYPSRLWRNVRPWPLRDITALATGLAAAILVWGLACVVAHEYCVARRGGYLRNVELLAERGTPAPETLHGDRAFTVSLPPDDGPDPVGFLLRIRAGVRPGQILCQQLRTGYARLPPRLLVTRHGLHPDREQFFVLSCPRGARFGDLRRYEATVVLDGDAQILSSTCLDLSGWNGPLLSTVFYSGQRSPGNPPVPAPVTAQTTYYPIQSFPPLYSHRHAW
ncbi:MAG TPA: hypothetical protein VG099_32525 [Gemmataceae bacterium]|jgi:hypothetical protein|nr:hypothetical protein [Gemmataceae bacterium]